VVDRLKEMLGKSELGDLYYLYSQRVNLGQIRPDENALWSFGPHDVSVALYLLGEMPVTLSAQGKSYLQRGIEDVVFLNLTFASGVMSHVQMSWLDPHKVRRLTVVGSRQMAVFDDMQPREKLTIYDKGVNRPPEYRLLRREPHDSRGRHLHPPAGERGTADGPVPAFHPGGPR
jgi:Predicted dehydrogenases and related proteins